MISHELRSKWQTIRPAEYDGPLTPCRECGSSPQVYVVDPVGLYIKAFMPDETFFAVRCSCGRTGELRYTGRNVFGEYITISKAATKAADVWNAEQEETA